MRIAFWLAWLGLGVLVALAYLWVPPAQAFKEPETARIIVFHVPAAFIAVGCFLLGGFFGWRYLRHRNPKDEARACACNEVGLLFGILTTLTGMVFAQQQWGKAWHWDPRQTTIVIQLLIYAAYFALRASLEDEQQRAVRSAGYTVFAALTVPLLIFVIPRIPAIAEMSLHPSSVVAQKGALDLHYRLTFYFGVIVYALMAFGLYRLRLQVFEMEEQVRELAERLSVGDRHHLGWNLRVSGVAESTAREPSEGAP